jgi:hypothetical protein
MDTWKNQVKSMEMGLSYLRSTSITYSGCSDLLYGYDDSGDLNKMRFTSGLGY